MWPRNPEIEKLGLQYRWPRTPNLGLLVRLIISPRPLWFIRNRKLEKWVDTPVKNMSHPPSPFRLIRHVFVFKKTFFVPDWKGNMEEKLTSEVSSPLSNLLPQHCSYNCAPPKCPWKMSLFLWVSQFRTLFSSVSVERGCEKPAVLLETPEIKFIFQFPKKCVFLYL